jgi:predicted enzyme related to lactoylglutathione lyase
LTKTEASCQGGSARREASKPKFVDLARAAGLALRECARKRQGGFVSPGRANGKICYIEIPATDVQRSAAFYESVFGWRLRTRGDGVTAFDDATGEVSGAFVLGRPPASEPGLLVYVMVDDCAAAAEAVAANGGRIIQPIGADAPEITARFTDPGGNVVGLYQEPA